MAKPFGTARANALAVKRLSKFCVKVLSNPCQNFDSFFDSPNAKPLLLPEPLPFRSLYPARPLLLDARYTLPRVRLFKKNLGAKRRPGAAGARCPPLAGKFVSRGLRKRPTPASSSVTLRFTNAANLYQKAVKALSKPCQNF